MDTAQRPRWSWQIARLFGIAIRIHVTLFALLVWIAVAAPLAGARPQVAIIQVAFIVAFFACVLAHELAHALVARRFACVTREIVLLPIGGIAQMERIPQRPAHELLVAGVGPLASLAIALALAAVALAAGWPLGGAQTSVVAAVVVPLMWSNLALAAFNVLPAFPMDGGRMLRAALAHRWGRQRATRVAVAIGKALAVGFAVVGLALGAPLLALIGVFVWFAADQESAMVRLTAVLGGATVADAMIQPPHVIDAGRTIDDAAGAMLADGQRELAVAEQGHIAGVVTASDLALDATAAQRTVATAMRRDVPVVAPTLPLADALEPLGKRGVVLVGDREAIVGVLTSDQVTTYAALHRAHAS